MANVFVRMIARWLPLIRFTGSKRYWEARYRMGGDSGAGSSGVAATYKAAVLNGFVEEQSLRTIIEFGCGDGRQLELATYPVYLGVDISNEAIRQCRERFAGDSGKRFMLNAEYAGERAQLALSLDVLYHLVEDSVYDAYLQRLFHAAIDYVVIYSTNAATSPGALRHVRDRPVAADIAERFHDFDRMHELEAALPPPVERRRGVATQFLIYKRKQIKDS